MIFQRPREKIAQRESDKNRNFAQKNDKLYTLINEKKKQTDDIKRGSEEINNAIAAIEQEKKRIVETLQGIQNSNKDLTDKLLAFAAGAFKT